MTLKTEDGQMLNDLKAAIAGCKAEEANPLPEGITRLPPPDLRADPQAEKWQSINLNLIPSDHWAVITGVLMNALGVTTFSITEARLLALQPLDSPPPSLAATLNPQGVVTLTLLKPESAQS